MRRFSPYLGIVFALVVAAGGASVTRVSVYDSASRAPGASTTLSVLPPLAPIPISLENLFPKTGEAGATEAKNQKSAPAFTAPASPEPATNARKEMAPAKTVAPTPSLVSSNISLDASASALRGALVHIICNAPAGSGAHSISASGVIITPSGIVLTNAHVAQYFLLADKGVSCVLRTGSPAQDRYRASLIYFPAAWIRANASLIIEAMPEGDGAHDYALLAITGSASDAPLPADFSAVSLSSVAPESGEAVVIGSYGAQFLSVSQILSDLFPTIVFSSVKAIYTFAQNSADVVSLGGSAAAQEGSSGGGVVDESGKLAAIIVTSTVGGDAANRNVNAITAAYLRADYASATGEPLDFLLAEPTARAVSDFAPLIPQLEAPLVNVINAN